MEKDEIFKEVAGIIKRHLGDEYKIHLFGSWAKETALETSDIDIGILGKEKAPVDVMDKIVREVETISTLRKIDIVDLNAKSEEFRNNVLVYAKIIN